MAQWWCPFAAALQAFIIFITEACRVHVESVIDTKLFVLGHRLVRSFVSMFAYGTALGNYTTSFRATGIWDA